MCTVLVVLAIWHIMQHVKDEIAFLEASVSSGFNVQYLVIDLDFYITGLTKAYLFTLPLCVGVSHVRALSPAWTGSPTWET
jgi:hypothetical protein